jgi:hypothetical protein
MASEKVRPFRVKESPVQYECKVREIIQTGDGPGAGNLVICDILLIHIHETVLDEKNEINQEKIDLVGRMGGDFYVRTNRPARFIVSKPLVTNGIGIDALPEMIRNSLYLTGNDLGQLGNLDAFPEKEIVEKTRFESVIFNLFFSNKEEYFEHIQVMIREGKAKEALANLLAVCS